MTVTDSPTRDDLTEKLGHLVESARRLTGTPAWYASRHAQINATLDALGAQPYQWASDTDLSGEDDMLLDFTLTRLFTRRPGDSGEDLELTRLAIASILTEQSRRHDAWLAGIPVPVAE